MPLLETAETSLHYEVHGHGAPVTVFAHGIASTADDVRFLGSGVAGTRVFFDFRGHGRSGTPSGDQSWGYPAVTRDLVAMADHVGATQCAGVSLGAGAILAAVEARPARFHRIVLLLPAGLDRVRPADPDSDLAEMARLIDRGDREALAALLTAQLPADIAGARGVAQLMRRRAHAVCRPGVASAIHALPAYAPLLDRSALGAFTGEALVVGHEGDEAHPASIARDAAAAIPGAALHVFDQPWSMFRERAALRRLLAGFLSAGAGGGHSA